MSHNKTRDTFIKSGVAICLSVIMLAACGGSGGSSNNSTGGANTQSTANNSATTQLGGVLSEGYVSVQETLYGGRDDEFYDIPNPLPAGQPGDIIKQREVLAPHFPEAKVVQVMYLSTDVHNAPAAVTGTVLIPTLDPSELPLPALDTQGLLPTTPLTGEMLGGNLGVPVGGPNYTPRPVVGLTPGTRGMGDHCAPSQGFNINTLSPLMVDYSTAEYHQLLLRGYIVAVTDYVGGGTDAPETYLIGRPEGMAGLDVIRAALNLEGTGAAKDSMIGITGYSQGGQASAWAAQLQPTYAPELNLKGVVTGGPVTDLLDQVDFWNQGGAINSGFLLATMIGLDNAYPELNLDSYITPEGEAFFEAARTQCVYQEIVGYPGIKTSDVTYPDFAQQPEVRQRMREQQLGHIPPQVPTYIYHGTLDNIVPYQFGEKLRDSWCDQGVTVEFRSGPYDHLAGIYTERKSVVEGKRVVGGGGTEGGGGAC